MPNALATLQPTLLMGPGPSCVHPDVYAALSLPTIGHLDPDFIALMDVIKTRLQALMRTENAMTVPMSGTGSAGMETCFVNLLEKGASVLILSNGVFGTRMTDLAERLGAEVDTLAFDWGTPILLAELDKKLAAKSYTLVAVVHAETSTGVCNPVEAIGQLVHQHHPDTLYLVDAVTSLGGIPVEVDAWNIDALYSGTQKCLSCPPGLSPVTFSPRAVEKLQNRQTKVPNWYLDLTMIANYWEGATRAYHHTAPINMLYALHAALGVILNEGLDNVHARHAQAHEQLKTGLEEIGLDLFVEESCRLPMLNAVTIPESVSDEAAIRKTLLQDHRIEIGPGLGPLAGKIWRIGLMGHTARPENVDRLLQALAPLVAPRS